MWVVLDSFVFVQSSRCRLEYICSLSTSILIFYDGVSFLVPVRLLHHSVQMEIDQLLIG